MPTVSKKGQVTIPKKFREKFGLKPGSEIEFEEEDGKLVVKKPRTDFGDYCGYLGEGSTDEFMEKVRGR